MMFDLQALALQGDVTPSDHVPACARGEYADLSGSRGYGPASSDFASRERSRQACKLAKINAYHVSLFAYFLEKLKSIPDGDGSLLDHTLYLFGSGMGNPDAHDHANLPILVAGGGAKGGRHMKYKEPTPLANLHLTLLDRVGVRLDSFADSRGRVQELLDAAVL